MNGDGAFVSWLTFLFRTRARHLVIGKEWGRDVKGGMF